MSLVECKNCDGVGSIEHKCSDYRSWEMCLSCGGDGVLKAERIELEEVTGPPFSVIVALCLFVGAIAFSIISAARP